DVAIVAKRGGEILRIAKRTLAPLGDFVRAARVRIRRSLTLAGPSRPREANGCHDQRRESRRRDPPDEPSLRPRERDGPCPLTPWRLGAHRRRAGHHRLEEIAKLGVTLQKLLIGLRQTAFLPLDVKLHRP